MKNIEINGCNFEYVNPSTVHGYDITSAFYYSDANKKELSDVYGKYSADKETAFNYCKYIEEHVNGYDGRITSKNTFMFTYSFLVTPQPNLRNANTYIVYITPMHDYITDYIA